MFVVCDMMIWGFVAVHISICRSFLYKFCLYAVSDSNLLARSSRGGAHNAALEQWVQGRRATTAGSVIMGDKGDGRRTAQKWNT